MARKRGHHKLIFRTNNKYYSGRSAIEVVRSLERDDKSYRHSGGPIREYLNWSLHQLSGSVPPRDLEISDRLGDETLALGYLVLLDEYGLGEIVSQPSTEMPNQLLSLRDGPRSQHEAQTQ